MKVMRILIIKGFKLMYREVLFVCIILKIDCNIDIWMNDNKLYILGLVVWVGLKIFRFCVNLDEYWV